MDSDDVDANATPQKNLLPLMMMMWMLMLPSEEPASTDDDAAQKKVSLPKMMNKKIIN